ncbi:MAG: hypothetical protein ACRDD1_19710 [Planctomycetia bacterium]
MADAEKQAAFEREFRGHIERFREPVVAALRTLVATPLPSGERDLDGCEFAVLSFEQQADWRHFPVRAFAMDRQAIDEADGVGPPFRGRMLPTAAGPLVPAEAIDQDAYEAAGVRTYESGARVLAEWFGECWHAAGGAAFPRPAYINLHDSSRYFDLHALRWVQHTEIGK